jgi:CRISPR type I-F-associated protein Csy2
MFGNDTLRRALVVPCARIDNVSVAPSAFVVGPPGPTALLGLMHRISLDLQAASIFGEEDAVAGVSLICHEFGIAPGHRRIPPERRGEHGEKAGAMIDDPEGYLTCSLIFEVIVSSPDVLEAARAYLARRLLSYRLAGGRIIRAGFATANGGTEHKPVLRPVEAAWDNNQFRPILRALPPGSVLADRTDLMAPVGPDDRRDALDRLLDVLAWRQQPLKEPSGKEDKNDEKHAPTGKMAWVRSQPGWIVPIHIGWRPLSAVADRAGMRSAIGVIGHVWAEDVVGLGGWVSTRKAFLAKEPAPVFWAYQIGPSTGPYLTRGRGISQD